MNLPAQALRLILDDGVRIRTIFFPFRVHAAAVFVRIARRFIVLAKRTKYFHRLHYVHVHVHYRTHKHRRTCVQVRSSVRVYA